MSGSLLVPDAATDLDRTLVARYASGDADALGLLYDRYGRVVFGVLQALLPSPEAAEEVAQDAFHAVWRRARDYDASKGSVRTWLFAIARNAAIDWRRTRGKRTERERPLEEVGDRPDPSADALVERAVRFDRVAPRDVRDVPRGAARARGHARGAGAERGTRRAARAPRACRRARAPALVARPAAARPP